MKAVQPQADPGNFFATAGWRRIAGAAKRMMNEGFGLFTLSLTLLTVGLCLMRTWWFERRHLQDEIQKQILSTVETEQAPTDVTKAGLIAAVLANINNHPASICNDGDSLCQSVKTFHTEVERLARKKLMESPPSPVTDGKEIFPIPHYAIAPDVSREEFVQGPLCKAPIENEGSYVLLPVQLVRYLKPSSVNEDITISSAL